MNKQLLSWKLSHAKTKIENQRRRLQKLERGYADRGRVLRMLKRLLKAQTDPEEHPFTCKNNGDDSLYWNGSRLACHKCNYTQKIPVRLWGGEKANE